MRGWTGPAATALVAATLVGCDNGSSSATSPPLAGSRTATVPAGGSSPSVSRPSEQEQAYQNAQKAYERFLAVFDEVLADRGQRPERLDKVAKGRALNYAKAVAADFRQNGYKGVGTTTIVSVRPLAYADTGATATVTLQSCEDARTSKALDRSGKPLTKLPGTPDFLRYVVTVASDGSSGAGGWTVQRLQNEAVKSC